MPARVLATLAGGWKSSASAKRQRRRLASIAAIVVLPEPETPMTIRAMGRCRLAATRSVAATEGRGGRGGSLGSWLLMPALRLRRLVAGPRLLLFPAGINRACAQARPSGSLRP
jgi:hypothetical protein